MTTHTSGPTLTVRIEMDGAAFDGRMATETCRILMHLATRLGRGDTDGKLLDTNGNQCGTFAIEDG